MFKDDVRWPKRYQTLSYPFLFNWSKVSEIMTFYLRRLYPLSSLWLKPWLETEWEVTASWRYPSKSNGKIWGLVSFEKGTGRAFLLDVDQIFLNMNLEPTAMEDPTKMMGKNSLLLSPYWTKAHFCTGFIWSNQLYRTYMFRRDR